MDRHKLGKRLFRGKLMGHIFGLWKRFSLPQQTFKLNIVV